MMHTDHTELRGLVGGLMMVDLPGPSLDAEWEEHLYRYRIGGVCLFRRNVGRGPEALTRLTARLRELLAAPPLIAVDQEGGSVARLDCVPVGPGAMALGAADDPVLTGDTARIMARGLRLFGINVDLAPVLDVQLDPANPVIGDRAFGDAPELIARHGAAFAAGLQAEGVMSCAKHFPGHGDTGTDSHLRLPTISADRTRVEDVELLPYRRVFGVGCGGVMTAHITYPVLDPDEPATFSRAVLHDLLRRELEFEGLAFTDALDMGAVAGRYDASEAAVRAVVAGADQLAVVGERELQVRIAEALLAAAARGRVPEARLREAAARRTRWMTRFPAAPREYGAPQQALDRERLLDAARRAICAVGAPPLPLPRSGTAPKTVLVSTGAVDRGAAGDTAAPVPELARLLAQKGFPVAHVTYRPDEPADALRARLTRALPDGPAALLWATQARTPRLGPAEAWLAQAAARAGVQRLHVALYNPYLIPIVGWPALASFGYQPVALQALAEVLCGERRAEGRMPIAGVRGADRSTAALE